MTSTERTQKILEELKRLYPNVKSMLNFTTPFELLVATILSAQSTDKQVNRITGSLFKKYNTPEDFAALEPGELEEMIKGCGLFRNKSKNIIAASRVLLEKYGGKVPQDLESLVDLPGVGRKTANVVLSNAFGKNAIAVDTHVQRVANRLGLADSPTPLGTELELQKAIPPELWSKAHHWLINHGRKVCSARKPDCSSCTLHQWCRNAQKEKKGQSP
ncbi:MAG TPA: endonuclease III [Clostridia bacterium]|jgi:endonuclease-3|nr:endonuclease III [Clostridia bacterium]